MGRRGSELVGHELPREGSREVAPAPHRAGHRLALARRAVLHAERREAALPVDPARFDEGAHLLGQRVLKARAAGDDDADRDRRERVQALEALQVAVEERVLVVPLDLERERAAGRAADMVDLVADGGAGLAVDDGLGLEVVLAPSRRAQRPAQALGERGLPAARADELGPGEAERQERRGQLGRLVGEVDAEDRARVVRGHHVEAALPQRLQDHRVGSRAASSGAVISDNRRRWRPSAKFAGSSQAFQAARRAGHSPSRMENQAVSRLRPFTTAAWRWTPS